MPRAVGFADAVRLLGGGESRLVKWLDALLTVGLTVAAPATKGVTLSLFEPKNQLITWLAQLRERSAGRLAGVDGRARGEVLTAAHTVLLVSAYFDTLAQSRWLAAQEVGWDADGRPVLGRRTPPRRLAWSPLGVSARSASRQIQKAVRERTPGVAGWPDDPRGARRPAHIA